MSKDRLHMNNMYINVYNLDTEDNVGIKHQMMTYKL
jgi:hypothetical protein